MKYRINILNGENQEKIEISEDEILEVKYRIGLVENNDFANNRSSVEMEITGKIISNLEEKNLENSNHVSDNNLYEKNKKNVIELVKWAESYLSKSDYRNIEMFVDLGANKSIDYKFLNMFVYDFSQEFSIEKGIGTFKLFLKQKFHQKDKMEIQ
ncbi:hypothetical protein [Leptotrichia sp.]|jgi:hypothetical protein|uniref:hypothetical protein n=1 Tax=Leptotrichia sp. TaxID=104608 RepID=UPI0017A2DD3D|nr:hypothetical protein [Leptotrichia sp.]MBB1534458.1 hypothetical protein [Leptotrichia sp.]